MKQSLLFGTAKVLHRAAIVDGQVRETGWDGKRRGTILALCGAWVRPSSVANPEAQQATCPACQSKEGEQCPK